MWKHSPGSPAPPPFKFCSADLRILVFSCPASLRRLGRTAKPGGQNHSPANKQEIKVFLLLLRKTEVHLQIILMPWLGLDLLFPVLQNPFTESGGCLELPCVSYRSGLGCVGLRQKQKERAPVARGGDSNSSRSCLDGDLVKLQH